MQRKISKKLSETLRHQQQEDEAWRRAHFPHLYPPQPPVQRQRSPPYVVPIPEEIHQRDLQNTFYPYPQIPLRNPSPTRTRNAAALANPSYPQNSSQSYEPPQQQNSSNPRWEPNYSSESLSASMSSDDLEDDVSLDEYGPDPILGLNYAYDPGYRPPSSNSVQKISSRDRDRERERDRLDREQEREREREERAKAKKSSHTFLPEKKVSKSRSITFQDPEYSGHSGSSSRVTSGSSSSYSSSRRRSGRTSSSALTDSESRPNDSSGVQRSGSSHRRHSSSRVGSGTRLHSTSSRASNSASREVMALPIEIPENVTDEDAFRRYLSVRRGALDKEANLLESRSESSMESVGLPGSSSAHAKAMSNLGHSIHRRTMALSQAIMTLALLSASASQLRFVVAYSQAQSYPALNYFLICTCIIVEILVGIGYVVLSRFDFTDSFVEKVHSYLIFGLFVVAVANVIIASFALDDHVCEGQNSKRLTETYDGVDQPLPQNPP